MHYHATMRTVDFKIPAHAFDAAIAAGRLSTDRNAPNFAGLYMYMGTVDGADTFKHVDTRRYLPQLGAAVSLALAASPSWAHAGPLFHHHAADLMPLAFVAVAMLAAFFVHIIIRAVTIARRA